jgi:hypothetical protein
MIKIKIISFILILLLTSCEEYNYQLFEADPQYPTILRELSPNDLEKLRNEFLNTNIFMWTSLDSYGFCGYGSDDLINAPDPSLDTTTSRSEAILIAKKFLHNNSKFTGVTDTSKVQFSKIATDNDWYDGSNGWVLNAALQKIDTIEVLTYLSVHIRNREVYFCMGNWYPKIYIPEKIQLSYNGAKKILLNRVVTHSGLGGPWNVTITDEDLQKSSTRFYIVPIERNDQIELHVAWLIKIPSPVYFNIYVDAITGEILRQVPTIISK